MSVCSKLGLDKINTGKSATRHDTNFQRIKMGPKYHTVTAADKMCSCFAHCSVSLDLLRLFVRSCDRGSQSVPRTDITFFKQTSLVFRRILADKRKAISDQQ